MAKKELLQKAFSAIVSGRVQGVGFRYRACREAERLGLSGWIRNDDDGSVEVVAEGEASAVDSFASWLEAGPPGAFVENLSLTPRAPTGYYRGFSIEF
jgi:acylphosphatase